MELFFAGFLNSLITTAIMLAVVALVYQMVYRQPWKYLFNPQTCKFWFILNVVFALLSRAPIQYTLGSVAANAVLLFVIAPRLYRS